MTRKLVIPGASFTGPKIMSDPMENAGSLMLVEPGHPVSSWSGVPSNGQALPNLVASSADALGITGAPSWYFNGLTGNKGRVERTAKGGVHGIVSASVAPGAAGVGAAVELPVSLVGYLIANPTHHYYYSMIDRQTRMGASTPRSRLMVGAGDGVNMHTYWYKSGIRPDFAWSNTWIGGHNTNASSVNTEPVVRAIGVKDWASSTSNTGGGVPSSPTGITRSMHWGAIGPINSSSPTSAGNFPSWVFYRLYIEDLTVSGRTFAQALAADQSLTASLTGPGGRYASDEFTDPATVG